MKYIFLLLYKSTIQLYRIVIWVAAPFNHKAKRWINNRKEIFHRLSDTFKNNKDLILWFHCASLGEYEQGKPIITALKKNHPKFKILLTFFSPSGYQPNIVYVDVDFVFSLPLDTKNNAKRFLQIVQPKIAFFVKYEFWYFYLKTLKKYQIPFFLIAGAFRKNQFFFKWYGKWYLEAIKGFSHLFLQDQNSRKTIDNQGFINASVSGDPRIERVGDLMENAMANPIVEHFKGDYNLFILGSSHKKDHELFIQFLNHFFSLKPLGIDTEKEGDKSVEKQWKFLIVPHEVETKSIQQLQDLIPLPSIRYTKIKELETLEEHSILIVDTIGLLSTIYQYGDIAFIGGGFDKSIHNILEPAAFGLPIIFGPNYSKFKEASDLIQLGGAFSISNYKAFLLLFNCLQIEQERKSVGQICANYIKENRGCTQEILNFLEKEGVL